MYSTRQPNAGQQQRRREHHPRPMPIRRHLAAEALFRKPSAPPVPLEEPSHEEIKRQLGLSHPQPPAPSEPVAPAPTERELTQQQKKELLTLYRYGLTAREAADYFGVSLQTIDNALGKFTRKRG
jgi:DNA-directed RNA polymerase specialized sigma24 family protein